VFADLGLADAEKLKIKTGLVIEIRKTMKARSLPQKNVGAVSCPWIVSFSIVATLWGQTAVGSFHRRIGNWSGGKEACPFRLVVTG
jgi:hypothetical protein